MWNELYGKDNMPTMERIKDYVNNELWDNLCNYIETTYNVLPKIEYSSCSMQKGWNVKYKKGGKSLVTLYPMENYYIALVVIGQKEKLEADFMILTCSSYTQNLYNNTEHSKMGSWLMIEVDNEEIYNDVITLIHLRTNKKK